MSIIKKTIILNAIMQKADDVIKSNKNANYDADLTPEIINGAKEIISDHNLTFDDQKLLWNMVRDYNLNIGEEYKVDLYSDEAKDNTQKFLDDNNIPQKTQVVLGLLDMVNGSLMIPTKPNTMNVINLKEMFG
tara:strand:- start:81 stop:479 length:399 start_codon:yes stop_codon:yes gene_type:complete